MISTASRNNLSDPEMFDNTLGYDDETGVRLAEGLTGEERQQAVTLYRLFNELWGVCIVVGDPGTGKDLFGNTISYKIKRYFPHKRIMRDEKPRALYGSYAGLFDDSVLAKDLARMRDVATGGCSGSTDFGLALEKAADDWVTKQGRVMLKNSVLYLTEFWRYCYRRDPMNPMNKTMGGIHKEKRHLDCLILGTVQLVGDLDRKTCLPWVDWKVTCTRSVNNPTGFTYYLEKVKYDRRMDILVPLSRDPFVIAFDAGKPRSYLGDGKLAIRKSAYKPETEEERIVLDAIRDGADTYETLVGLLAAHGDMDEGEVLHTLKELKFRKRKRVVDYGCFFGLYNSKSAPQMHTSLKVVEE